jgi:hypothetical protein
MLKKINITLSAILINQYHSQRNLENNSPSISKVTNKSNDKNISGTNLLNESVSEANVAAQNNMAILLNTTSAPRIVMKKKLCIHKSSTRFLDFWL